jgi:ribosomal protein S12 methylthiotransferase accessory factor YcaO
MKELIQKLRDEHLKVTIHDIGEEKAVFVLAVVIDEPIDIWYVAFVMGANTIPKMIGNLLVFPELVVDVKTYDFICA